MAAVQSNMEALVYIYTLLGPLFSNEKLFIEIGILSINWTDHPDRPFNSFRATIVVRRLANFMMIWNVMRRVLKLRICERVCWDASKLQKNY